MPLLLLLPSHHIHHYLYAQFSRMSEKSHEMYFALWTRQKTDLISFHLTSPYNEYFWERVSGGKSLDRYEAILCLQVW